jgi:small subunit ribosomal protein S15e
MADELDAEAVAALRKKRQFKKFTFRGLELEKLLDLSKEELLSIVHARARRRMQRGLNRKAHALIKKLRKAKSACGPLDKPAPVKTHLRNMIIVPEMIGSNVAVYNGKVFNLVLITADMIGSYLGEYSISYRPVRHGRPGLGSTNSSRFIPLK